MTLAFDVSTIQLCNNLQGLGFWVATQKVAYRFDKATMPQGRIDALDAMGFTWQSEKRADSWSKYFDELVDYIQVSDGSSLCPFGWES